MENQYYKLRGIKVNKIKIIALCGQSGCGKNKMLNELKRHHPNYNRIIGYTTRPLREGEVNGTDYNFITQNEFIDLIQADKMAEYAQFNGWFYGTCIVDLQPEQINIGIFSPAAIRSLLKREDIDLKVFYIFANPAVRLIRQLSREKNPNINEILRRYQTDLADFQHLEFEYTMINNSDSLAVAFAELEDKIG